MHWRKIGYRFLARVILTIFWISSTHAALHLELTQGVDAAIPLGMIPFDTQVTDIVKNDLQNSGEFRIQMADGQNNQPATLYSTNLNDWKQRGVNYLLLGQTSKSVFGQETVTIQLINLYTQSKSGAASDAVLLNQRFNNVRQSAIRSLAHHISDLIYEKLTGIPGIFSTKIAYVLVQKGNGSTRYLLQAADADGFNPNTLLSSSQPIMSPTWAPDGTGIAYVSFEGHEASIYLQHLKNGSRQLISRFPGINGAPAFSPNGKQMALVLTKTGNPNIFLLNLSSGKITELTQGYAIDTEPVWSRDGRYLYFTSNRAGLPQIYRYDFSSGQVARVTFDGNYNARACLTPDNQTLVMIHRDSGTFSIAKQDLNSGRVTVLSGMDFDDSPSVAPNGKMVLYGTRFAGRSVLGLVSMDGRVKLRLPSQEGDIQDPAWSPYLSTY